MENMEDSSSQASPQPPLATYDQVVSYIKEGKEDSDAFCQDAASGDYQQHLTHALSTTHHAMERLGVSDLIISSGEPTYYFLDDQHVPFRSHPHFRYLCPLEGAYHLIHLSLTHRPLVVTFASDSYWVKATDPTHHPRWQDLSLSNYLMTSFSKLDQRFSTITGRLASQRKVFIGADSQIPGDMEKNPSDVLDALGMIRTKKTPWEIRCTVEATQSALLGHQAVKAAFLSEDSHHPLSERELFYIYQKATGEIHQEFPYEPIIAMDDNASYLHYNHRTRLASALTSTKNNIRPFTLLVDAGASTSGYGSDITRTHLKPYGQYLTTGGHQVSREAYGVFDGLINELTKAEQKLWQMATDTACFNTLHQHAERMIASILIEAGLITQRSATEPDPREITKIFFPHGLGHMLGLLTHDFSHLKKKPNSSASSSGPLRHRSELACGNLFTIEPGIYFIPSLLTKLKGTLTSYDIDQKLFAELVPLGGIRIEDNIYITSSGKPVNLTRLCEAQLSSKSQTPQS